MKASTSSYLSVVALILSASSLSVEGESGLIRGNISELGRSALEEKTDEIDNLNTELEKKTIQNISLEKELSYVKESAQFDQDEASSRARY